MDSRLTEPFRAAVERVTPGIRFAGTWRYSVVSCNFLAQTISASPLNPDMPPLSSVPMAIPGIKLDIAPGAVVLVGFAENDPTLPYVAQYPQDPAQVLRMALLGGLVPVALQGMAVSVTIPASSLTLAVSGSSATGPTSPLSVTGTITQGSTTITGAV